jgi:hypothetical protein
MEKGKILDEFAKTTGLHRKSVIRILHRPVARGSRKRGRPPNYGARVVEMLTVFEASAALCSGTGTDYEAMRRKRDER